MRIRRDLINYCDQHKFDTAQLLLIESNIAPEDEPGLWEYLARRSYSGGDSVVAHVVRRSLWEAGVWSGDVALKEADYHLKRGDAPSALFLILSVYGSEPADNRACLMLARGYLTGIQAEQKSNLSIVNKQAALRLAKKIEIENEIDAITAIDLLRFTDQYELALQYNDEAKSIFPHDVRFLIREARIRERMNDLERARQIWIEVSEKSSRYRIEAVFKVIRLCLSLEHSSEAIFYASQLLLEKLTILDRMRFAELFGQEDILQALLEMVAAKGSNSGLIDAEEGADIAKLLLDRGSVGWLVWLRRLRIPIGRQAIGILEAAGFSADGTQPAPQSIRSASEIKSPDCLLPLDQFLNLGRKPVGWPGTGIVPERLLLVNAGLNLGGAERQFITLIESLLTNGFDAAKMDVALFSTAEDLGHSHFLTDLQSTGVRIHDLRERNVANALLPQNLNEMVDILPTPLRSDVTALWHLANDIRPNIIHGWQDRSAFACGIVGRVLSVERIVLSFRNMSPATRRNSKLMAHRELVRDFGRSSNVLLTANSIAGSIDYADWIDLPNIPIPLLSNAVDTRKFSAKNVKWKKRMSARSPVRISGIFRLVANKRPHLWLRTVAELRNAYGLDLEPKIFGRGALYDEILELAVELGVGDTSIQAGVSDPESLYADTDVLLLMSRVEGTPNVVLEAQACGIPVAACDVGGVSEVLHQTGETGGLLIGAGEDAELAARRIFNWLPGVLGSDPDERVAFVESRYSTNNLASVAKSFYVNGAGALNGN